jgi:elongation factor Ts
MGGKAGVMIDLGCETDFVAKSDDFKNLAHEICLQIVAMNPEDVDGLMEQAWVKDGSRTVKSLIEEYIGKVGENIVLRKFVKYEI